MLGLADADHTEDAPDAKLPLITLVSCPVVGRPDGAPRLSGRLKINVTPDSLAHRLVQRDVMEEAYFCNYEFNPQFHSLLEGGTLRITGRDDNNVARIVELPSHRFYLCTQFLPQCSSTAAAPHPLMTAFVQAAFNSKNGRA